MTEEFWQKEKRRRDDNPYENNLIIHKTNMDTQQKNMAKVHKNPKALYVECIKNSTYWHHYSASEKITVRDLAMMVCKNIGCEINYCQLIKFSKMEAEAEPDRECTQEISNFNNCMQIE